MRLILTFSTMQLLRILIIFYSRASLSVQLFYSSYLLVLTLFAVALYLLCSISSLENA